MNKHKSKSTKVCIEMILPRFAFSVSTKSSVFVQLFYLLNLPLAEKADNEQNLPKN